MKVAEINLRSKSKAVSPAVCVSRLGSVKTFMKAGKADPLYLFASMVIPVATPSNGQAHGRDLPK